MVKWSTEDKLQENNLPLYEKKKKEQKTNKKT